MRTILLLFVGALFVGCASNRAPEYPFQSIPLGSIGLLCSNEEALAIAKSAALEKYPNTKEKLKKYNFSDYTSTYSGKAEAYPHQYHLKAIFQYYPIGKPEFGNFFSETVTVSLTKECQVISVEYSKGFGQL